MAAAVAAAIETLTCGLRSRLRCRRRFHTGEIYFRSRARPLAGGKVSVIAFEAGNPRPKAVREEADEGVVVLKSVVIAFAFNGDAVFRSSELILKAQKVFIGT